MTACAGVDSPTVATPDFSYEPAYGDDHLEEGYPAVDDSSFPLRTQRTPTILDASSPSGTTTPPSAPASPSPQTRRARCSSALWTVHPTVNVKRPPELEWNSLKLGFSILDIGCLRWKDIDEQLSEIIGPGEHGPVTVSSSRNRPSWPASSRNQGYSLAI